MSTQVSSISFDLAIYHSYFFLIWNKKDFTSSIFDGKLYFSFLVLPSHAHFHTCESIGERFATSSSINSVSCWNTNILNSFSISYHFSLLISTYAILKSSLTHFRYDQITRTLKKMNRNIIRTEDLNDLESDFVVCFDRLFYPLAAKICTTYTWEILDTATKILSLHTIIVHQNGMDHRALK